MVIKKRAAQAIINELVASLGGGPYFFINKEAFSYAEDVNTDIDDAAEDAGVAAGLLQKVIDSLAKHPQTYAAQKQAVEYGVKGFGDIIIKFKEIEANLLAAKNKQADYWASDGRSMLDQAARDFQNQVEAALSVWNVYPYTSMVPYNFVEFMTEKLSDFDEHLKDLRKSLVKTYPGQGALSAPTSWGPKPADSSKVISDASDLYNSLFKEKGDRRAKIISSKEWKSLGSFYSQVKAGKVDKPDDLSKSIEDMRKFLASLK